MWSSTTPADFLPLVSGSKTANDNHASDLMESSVPTMATIGQVPFFGSVKELTADNLVEFVPAPTALSPIKELCCGSLLDDMKETLLSIQSEMTKNFLEDAAASRHSGPSALQDASVPPLYRCHSAPDPSLQDTPLLVPSMSLEERNGPPSPPSRHHPRPYLRERPPSSAASGSQYLHPPALCPTRTYSTDCSVTSTSSSRPPCVRPSASHDERERSWLERATRRIDGTPPGRLTRSLVEEVGRVMAGWAKRRSRKAALVVERLLKRVIDEFEGGNEGAVATTAMYNMAIDGWAKSGDDVAASRAEDILQLMTEQHSRGNHHVSPDTISFNSVLNAWAANGEATRAEEILRHMDALHAAGNVDVKPNVRSFNSVIDAWAKSRVKGAAGRAEEILANMETLYSAGNNDVRPTDISYNAVINAWAKSGEKGAAQRAEGILKRMDDLYKGGNNAVKPNVRSFNVVIDAWAKCGEKGAASRAAGILDWMEVLYFAGNKGVKPDTISFNAVIDAYAKSSDPIRAEGILVRMENMETGRGARHEVGPNTRSFNSVLNAWARSRHTGAAERCLGILERMKLLYQQGSLSCAPDVFSYTTVISACAYTFGEREEQRRAMGIAFATFDELRECGFGSPDTVTYVTLLKACTHLTQMNEERFLSVHHVFNCCCVDGLLGHKVIKQLQDAVPKEIYNHLTGGGTNSYNMPFEWSRNVINTRRNHGRSGGSCGSSNGAGNYNGKNNKNWNKS